MPFDAVLISDVSIDEFLKVDDALVMCDLKEHECKICFEYADKIPVSEYRASLGGNSANVAAGMAKLGLNVSVYSEIGNDANGERFFRELKERGIDTSLMVKSLNQTDIHSIIVYKGERTIFSYHGPKKYKIQSWGEPRWIYYSSLPKQFEPFQQQLVDYLKEHPKILTAFNPGVYHFKAGFKAYAPFLQITDLLFVNKEEALRILEQSNAGVVSNEITLRGDFLWTSSARKQLHTSLQKLGPKMTVITNAENGASVSDGINFAESGIVEINKPITDKTGAGDAFASGFLSALIYGKSLEDSLKWGLTNSSACIREIGPMNGLLSRNEVEQI
ncbi:MAG: carbohydrate kinase family protein [Patescibacteria group bacterium]